jgi:hypothetical protein
MAGQTNGSMTAWTLMTLKPLTAAAVVDGNTEELTMLRLARLRLRLALHSLNSWIHTMPSGEDVRVCLAVGALLIGYALVIKTI